jgi:hypothetical protein
MALNMHNFQTRRLSSMDSHSDRRGCFLCNASVDQAQIDPETGKRVDLMMQRLLDAFSGALMTARV